MYELLTDEVVEAQLASLPEAVVAAYLEARQAVELAPWSAGSSMYPSNPKSALYAADVGQPEFDGTIIYFIDEIVRRVPVLEVMWL